MATPKLRFKEFDGYLEKNNLINLTLWASGGTPSKKNKDYWMGDIPLISGASMHTRKICESEFNITDLGLKKGSKLAPKNSILILVRGSMLFKKIPMGMALKDVAFNQDVKSIITKEDLNEYYFFQWLLSQENIIQNKVTSTGIGAGKLDTSELQNLEIYYPAKEEQTKIATFLSAVDTKIDELTQKHELLTEYKKGMMQQLFSQKMRFKADNGSDFEDWDDVLIEDIFTVTRGKVLAATETKPEPTPEYCYPVFSSQTKNNGLMGFFSNYLFEDAITWTTDGAHAGDVNFRSGQFYCTNVCGVLLSDKGYSNMCIAGILDSIAHKYVSYVGNPKLMNNVMAKIPICIPSNIEEQTKIANFLTAIDQKINNVAEQIDHAKTWKKGLLQQMFV